jgi:ATP-dependent helicase/nuclease subunit A
MAKPPGSSWTDDQWRAISERGSNLLVAAAAGSGKTAVLVERIIRRITDPLEPTDVDRLLVATFTKAAADEMRHRIREALEQQLVSRRGDEHLTRQIALLNKAAITTLHSFCLEVVQAYFYKIPLDPVFRIANETEAELLKSEALDELFEDEYATDGNEAFIRLVDCFGGERSDEAVIQLVRRLYEFSRSHPWPEHWLEETARRFRDAHDSAQGMLMLMLQEVKRELEGCYAQLQAVQEMCLQPGGPAPYMDAVLSDMAAAGELIASAERGDWDALKRRLDDLQFARLKACRGDQYDVELVETAKELRNNIKNKITGLHEELFQRSAEQYVNELVMLSPVVDALVRLVSDFAARYATKKQDKGLVDFNDLEHYCLAILLDPSSTPDHPQPSEVALEYQSRFVEVLLDEYQDTNRVQEMIVELISRSDGNRFMVGDVKQSIYRFRLAEPTLFLEKYRSYMSGDGGQRIDLSRNFRSRREVVDAVNYIFRQIMYERAAEITYDEAAELRYGASYYEEAEMSSAESHGGTEASFEAEGLSAMTEIGSAVEAAAATDGSVSAPDYAVELIAADRSALADRDSLVEREEAASDEEDESSFEADAAEMEAVQVEARMIGLKIAELMGRSDKPPQLVYDRSTRTHRPPTYRDIVILLRATQAWAPVIIEELRMMGIPAYAELSTGYFAATEVQVMLSLLKVIDNPLQDIPLAGVLRSPIFRFTAEELAKIRIVSRDTSFYEAVRRAAEDNGAVAADDQLRGKVRAFLERLEQWRTEARQGSLADLIWRIYRETGYYDLVGGLPGGMQRQANLRALYDRARTYETTTFRGLFRFLRFIEWMQDNHEDLGAARALGEQEDVVRIMTIHKSKGLEFPIVFVAGLAKKFNEQDLNQSFLLHKEWGLGPKYVDPDRRISLPSLAWLAVRRRLRAEMLAEEMRILYVALTRAREKLILVSSFRDLAKETAKWRRLVIGAGDTLSDHTVLQARSYADWIFPALIRHPATRGFAAWGGSSVPQPLLADSSKWQVSLVPAEALLESAAASELRSPAELRAMLEEAAHQADGLAADEGGDSAEPAETVSLIRQRFEWRYPHQAASSFLSKITVTEIKRLVEQQRIHDEEYEEEPDIDLLSGRSAKRIVLTERPSFLEEVKLTAAERGTAYHTVMQHVPLDQEITPQFVEQLISQLVERQLLTKAQAEAVDSSRIAAFFLSDLARRMRLAERLYREQPFSYRLNAVEVYRDAAGDAAEEAMLIQGVIDCLFIEPDGVVLIDYKTDALKGMAPEVYAEKYDVQIGLYARAVSDIWRLPVKECYLYFFDGPHLVNRSSLLDGQSIFR